MAYPVAEAESLKIGDIIHIKNLKLECFLFAEGILQEDVSVNSSLTSFEDALFCLHLQRQYSAATELEKCLKTHPDAETSDDSGVLKYYQALLRGRQNEHKLNESYMKQKAGSPICFGDHIQLFHIKSGKYVTIVPDKLARDERENIHVTLDASGCPHSWLQILPRYKIDREGDRILNNTEVIIKVVERPNEYIHCSEKSPSPGYFHEVNCSLETTSWKLSLYQGKIPLDESIITASQLVYIHDPETRSNVTMVSSTQSIDGTDDHVAIKPIVSGNAFDSNNLWIVESKKITVGGPLRWRKDFVRFRNLNSGKYLCIVESSLKPRQTIQRRAESTQKITLTKSSVSAGTLFNLHELHSSSTYVTDGKAMQMACSGLWIARGDFSNGMFSCYGSKERTKGVNLLVHKYTENMEDHRGANVLCSDPLDVYVGVAARNFLRKFLSQTSSSPSRSLSMKAIWPNLDTMELDNFLVMLQRIINFVDGYAISAVNIALHPKPSDFLRKIRQKMICDQGALGIVMKLIEKLIPVSESSNSGLSTKAKTEGEKNAVLYGNKILKNCLSFVYESILKHPQNQMFVADLMQILLSHVKSQPLAAKCITEMLRDNVELHELKISASEINMFTEKLRSSRMNSMYLHLLKACCSCNGRGVIGNQRMVSDIFFRDYNDIVITVHCDPSHRKQVHWENIETSLYFPKHVKSSPVNVFGYELVSRGLPALSLSWTTNHVDFSPLGLFGKLSIDIEELFTFSPPSKFENQGSTLIDESKRAVAEYFSLEMALVAEMCLDRNYSAMKRAEKLFPYEVLISLIKINVDDRLKSGAIQLINHLYVDRNPQTEKCLPVLTRKFNAAQNDIYLQPPSVESSRVYHFALLQHLAAENISAMRREKWSEVSLRYMQLLQKLVMFSYYGSEEKLSDVIAPLLKVLDRRKLEDSSNHSNYVLSKSHGKGKMSNNAKIVPFELEANALSSAEFKNADNEWQARTLHILESLPVLVCIILLVLVAIGVTIYQSMTGAEGESYVAFEMVVLGIFVFEISLRYYCFVSVHNSYTYFFRNWLNWVDTIVVLIDIALLGIPTSSTSGAEYSKSLRIARLARLVRILRAARLVDKLAGNEEVKTTWKPPTRYTKTDPVEVSTMVEAMKVLKSAQLIVEDRCLSYLLDGFFEWQRSSEMSTKSAGEIFATQFSKATKISLGQEMFIDIFLDNIMYDNADLVQVDLDLLMAHHTLRGKLLSNIQKVQLIESAKSIQLHDKIDEMLLKLNENIETNAVWSQLKSSEDIEIEAETKRILKNLVALCKERRIVLEFDSDFQPISNTQNLLRNLGFCGLFKKMQRLLLSTKSSPDSDVAKNNISLFNLCNELMYWFVVGNDTNQNIVFNDIQFYFDTLDSNVGSHLVIQAIFSNNEELMRMCPKKLILEFTDKVCSSGKYPQYLTLHGAITNTRGKNIIENQYEIVKQLISPARVHRLVSFFCPITHEDYKRKVELMAPFLNKRHVAVESLPLELRYHLEFLRVLSGCTVGRSNLNTIEAKVQSLYDYVDMLDAILDPRSILIVKTRLTLFFFNAMIDVEVVIPGIAQSARMWRLLQSFAEVFADAYVDLKSIRRFGWEDSDVDRQVIEHMIVCAQVTEGFFQCLFDPSKIRGASMVVSEDRVQMNLDEVYSLIEDLYRKIKNIVDLKSSTLDDIHVEILEGCLDGLNKSSATSLLNIESDPLDESLMTNKGAENSEEPMETVASDRLKVFCDILNSCEDVQLSVKMENQEFVSHIEALPFLREGQGDDLQFEPLIEKIVGHIRGRLVTKGEEKRLDTRCTQTSIWLMGCFRTLVENRWGMSIYERDSDGGEQEDEASEDVVLALNDCGVTTLCLDLISVGIDAELVLECVKLCVALLFKEGGNYTIQTTIFNHLIDRKSESFFLQVRSSIQKLVTWHEWRDVIVLENGEDPDLPEEIIFIRFLQLMCEGHFEKNQNVMREQSSNEISINLLDDFIIYLNALSRIPCRTSSTAAIQLTATILEVIQGPCELNQDHFILQTELLETLNRLLRSQVVEDCVYEEECELKKTGIDIIQALLEGRCGDNTVYERVLSVIHIDIIHLLSTSSETSGISSLQTESHVLLKMLCDYKPSLALQLEELSENRSGSGSEQKKFNESEVACVEVLWRGELQRRFFTVPRICQDLAKKSKDALVESVDRSNSENKLQDFLLRSHELYREILHQQVLKEWSVSKLFSRSNQNTATWISFFLALVINMLMLGYYSAESGEPSLPHNVRIVVDVLNLIQLFFSLFTLILFLVVRVPIKYQSHLAAGNSKPTSVMLTTTDGLTMYYCFYFIVCLLAINYSDTFLTFLLLDIVVKNSTTRDVLNAVIYPRRQLAITALLGVFVVYIFSFVIFYNFRDEMVDGPEKTDCDELYRCLLTVTGYGIRLETGIGENMIHTLGPRWIIDNLYFFVIIIILLNVIFGIIIDTFSDLRTKKIKMLEDTNQRCFICGIDKNVFDRAIDAEQLGFKHHISQDHNMWNYLNFIIHIWEQDKDDDDGLEQFVRRCVEADDITFFPLNRAMRLNLAISAGEGLRQDLIESVDKKSRRLSSSLELVESNISETLNTIAYSFAQGSPFSKPKNVGRVRDSMKK